MYTLVRLTLSQTGLLKVWLRHPDNPVKNQIFLACIRQPWLAKQLTGLGVSFFRHEVKLITPCRILIVYTNAWRIGTPSSSSPLILHMQHQLFHLLAPLPHTTHWSIILFSTRAICSDYSDTRVKSLARLMAIAAFRCACKRTDCLWNLS